MNAIKRRMEIYNRLLGQQTVEVSALARDFKVSSQTIRRDLQELKRQNLVTLSYGGAQLVYNPNVELHFSYKETENLKAKESICQKALTLINDGQTIAIDSGTTTLALFRLLLKRKVRIITSSLPQLSLLSDQDKLEVIIAGGTYDILSAATMGGETANFFARYNTDIAFLTTMGLAEDGFLSVVNPDDALVKNAIFANSKYRVLLLDETKFNRSYLCKYQNVEEFDLVITNGKNSDGFLKKFKIKYI